MNKVLKRKWIKALRSGEYTQGVGYLCKFNVDAGYTEYCCLGVLYEVKNGENSWQPYGKVLRTKYTRNETMYGEGLLGGSTCEKLTELNDTGKSFKYIADWIEKNVSES